MPYEAQFRRGENVEMMDHTPGSAIEAGTVVVLGDIVAIAHRDIPANVKGALAIGGGQYKALAAAAYTVGTHVYWDNTANRVNSSAAAGANKYLGKIVSASSGADTYCEFTHIGSSPAA